MEVEAALIAEGGFDGGDAGGASLARDAGSAAMARDTAGDKSGGDGNADVDDGSGRRKEIDGQVAGVGVRAGCPVGAPDAVCPLKQVVICGDNLRNAGIHVQRKKLAAPRREGSKGDRAFVNTQVALVPEAVNVDVGVGPS